MPFTVFVSILTLAPAICALFIAALGFARRALAPLVLLLAIVGALIPIICLLVLAPSLATGAPLQVTLFGASACAQTCFAPTYRLDAFALYAALGLTVLIVPMLLWMAWIRGLAPAQIKIAPNAASVQDMQGTEQQEAESADITGTALGRFSRQLLGIPAWGGVALALCVETAVLTLLFADNVLWLGLCWLVLAALAWGLGEIGNDLDTIDRPGLAFMLIGPLLWAIAIYLPVHQAQVSRFIDLMGRGGTSVWQVIFLAIALACAGGAYPFTVWVRRRAALATPAGLAALALILLPATLFVGARTYSAIEDANNLWPQIGQAKPSVTAGTAFLILGTITVVLSGMLALARRDGRSLVAFAAAAQVGWGLLALGVGAPASLLGLTILLATSVFGLGAMLAALFVGGTLTADVELDGAGPRAFGTPLRPLTLAAWCIGAASLVGAPLFAGFVSRQIISAAALGARGLVVPLVGIAWAGDALLTLALLRATAPAFSRMGIIATASSEAEGIGSTDQSDEPDEVDTLDDKADEGEDANEQTIMPRRTAARGRLVIQRNDLHELPAIVLAALALIVGIAPQLLLNFGGKLSATTLVQRGALDSAASVSQLGYVTGVGQWLPSLAWLTVIVLVVVLAFLRPDSPSVKRPLALVPTEAAAGDADSYPLAQPAQAWRDLDPIFTSMLTLPAGGQLLAGTDDEEPDEDDVTDETDETDEASEGDESEVGDVDEAEELETVEIESAETRPQPQAEATSAEPAPESEAAPAEQVPTRESVPVTAARNKSNASSPTQSQRSVNGNRDGSRNGKNRNNRHGRGSGGKGPRGGRA